MDEPFAAVDAITRTTLQVDLIRLWQQTGISIIFVTHNIDEAVFLAQRVVVMRPHPGSVKDILSIDLPYPRSLASQEFSKTFADISEALNA
jgi:NitT/TauT family transport system ATP-binding protein